MKLIKISLDELKPLINFSFQDDQSLLDNYHIIENGALDEIVNDTYEKICGSDHPLGLDYYAIVYAGKQIGYTCISANYAVLYSFGINIYFREKQITWDWFDLIAEKMGSFKCYLWNRNTRAINFLERRGMEIEEIKDIYTSLIYQGGN